MLYIITIDCGTPLAFDEYSLNGIKFQFEMARVLFTIISFNIISMHATFLQISISFATKFHVTNIGDGWMDAYHFDNKTFRLSVQTFLLSLFIYKQLISEPTTILRFRRHWQNIGSVWKKIVFRQSHRIRTYTTGGGHQKCMFVYEKEMGVKNVYVICTHRLSDDLT